MKTIHQKRTLMAWSKEDLAEHVLCLEHNLKAMQQAFEVQYANCVKIIEDMSQLNEGLKKSRTLAAMPEEDTR